jgi:nucleotide-binding universal stress UspA family protein
MLEKVRRILAGLDGSPSSEALTSRLIAQMKTDDADVRLLHVVDPFPMKVAETKGGRE